MVRLVAAGVVLLGWGVGLGQGAPAAGTGAKRPMTFADLMAMKRVSDPQISPSGRWVLFSVTEVSLEKNSKVNHLWVVPIAGGGERLLRAEKQAGMRERGKTAVHQATAPTMAADTAIH